MRRHVASLLGRAAQRLQSSGTVPAGRYAVACHGSGMQNPVRAFRTAERIPGPPRNASALYNAVVHPRGERHSRPRGIDEDAESDKPRVSHVEVQLRSDLLQAGNDRSIEQMNAALLAFRQSKFSPPAKLALQVMRACVALGAGEQANELFNYIKHSRPGQNQAHALRAGRVVLGLVHASKKSAKDVLRVMECTEEVLEMEGAEMVEHLDFRRDAVAWGLLAWALNKTGRPQDTLRVLDAVALNTGMTTDESLCHLSIEALGMLGRLDDANQMVDIMRTRGMQMTERTVGSLLRLLTVPGSGLTRKQRRVGTQARIRELCALIEEPSERFVSTSLRAYVSVGLVSEAESAFEKLAESRAGSMPDERACMTLMRVYATQLLGEVPESLPDETIDGWYEGLAAGADKLWHRYTADYGDLPPSYGEAHARLTIFPRYLLTKGVAGDCRGALELIKAAFTPEAVDAQPWFHPNILHFQALFFSIQRACDMEVLDETLRVMAEHEVDLDDTCLASVIFALVGNGDALRAGKVVSTRGPNLLAETSGERIPIDQRKRLGRRLDLLMDGLKQLRNPTSEGNDEVTAVLREVTMLASLLEEDVRERAGNHRLRTDMKYEKGV